ncbi:hypothetical protein MXD62_16970 [Frankia sp. Mgl5]|uniref:hypothetical protein n=1 Tax=Frankia sp. Mgl5 TaxID=2933793 RepID=UPI00200C24C0|nr:hypothetical protein [Frankia sp. Mgl5]MCK9928850.1 hypothetical protein [Frankia sp. Mgl5]
MTGTNGDREPNAGVPMNLPLRLMELDVRAALTQMEKVEVTLAYFGHRLPMVPLERAAFTERVETIAEELRWLRDRVAQAAGRAEQAEGLRPDGGLTRRSAVKPWSGTTSRRIPGPRRGCGDDGPAGAGR